MSNVARDFFNLILRAGNIGRRSYYFFFLTSVPFTLYSCWKYWIVAHPLSLAPLKAAKKINPEGFESMTAVKWWSSLGCCAIFGNQDYRSLRVSMLIRLCFVKSQFLIPRPIDSKSSGNTRWLTLHQVCKRMLGITFNRLGKIYLADMRFSSSINLNYFDRPNWILIQKNYVTIEEKIIATD